MKKIGVILGLFLISLLLAACNNSNEKDSAEEIPAANEGDSNSEEKDGTADTDSEANDKDDSNPDNEAEEDEYIEEQVSGDYLIYGEWQDGEDLLLYFTRTNDDLSREERIHQSLMESDPSQNRMFSATENFEVDGNIVNLYFNEDDDLSMASTESKLFWKALDEIGFRYGIEEYNLFNQDGERGLVFAEGNWEEPVEIEQESNRGYYVIPSEESERGEYTYISGSEAGEQIYSEDDELFDFGQTIEAMATTENDDGSYHSGIYEGVEIEEATIDGNQAIVKYHINDDTEASQQEMEDFEQVLQLAALDFQAEELEIINETERIISAYPLLVETEDSANDNSSSEENSNTEDQEENTEITEEDALSIVMDFVDEHKDVDREEVKMMVQDNQETEEYYKIQAFVFSGEEGEDQMTNTVGWYLVDKETGDIEEDM